MREAACEGGVDPGGVPDSAGAIDAGVDILEPDEMDDGFLGLGAII
jgi:hypothetical protein